MFAIAQQRGEIRAELSAQALARLTQLIFHGVTLAWALSPDSGLLQTTEAVWDLIRPLFLCLSQRKSAVPETPKRPESTGNRVRPVSQLRESYRFVVHPNEATVSGEAQGKDFIVTGMTQRGSTLRAKIFRRGRIAVSVAVAGVVLAIASLLAVAPVWAQAPAAGAVPAASSSSSVSTSSAPTQSAASPTAQGSDFSGSVPSQLVPGVLPLSLQDAIDRGLKQNLGLLLSSSDVNSARGQRWQQLSNLLPHLNLQPYADISQVNLAEFGFTFHFPGISIPTVVGPFAYFDARAYLTQSLLDLKSLSNTHAASERIKSAQYTYKDARDLVSSASATPISRPSPTKLRSIPVSAQVDTAQALYNQANDQVNAGTSPAIDALRAHVELQTRQQQLIQAKNDFAIQKLSLSRIIGLAAGQQLIHRRVSVSRDAAD